MINLEKFREENIRILRKYQEFVITTTDKQIKKVDKAESIKEILQTVFAFPSEDNFIKFMQENGSTRNISTPGKPGEETQH